VWANRAQLQCYDAIERKNKISRKDVNIQTEKANLFAEGNQSNEVSSPRL